MGVDFNAEINFKYISKLRPDLAFKHINEKSEHIASTQFGSSNFQNNEIILKIALLKNASCSYYIFLCENNDTLGMKNILLEYNKYIKDIINKNIDTSTHLVDTTSHLVDTIYKTKSSSKIKKNINFRFEFANVNPIKVNLNNINFNYDSINGNLITIDIENIIEKIDKSTYRIIDGPVYLLFNNNKEILNYKISPNYYLGRPYNFIKQNINDTLCKMINLNPIILIKSLEKCLN